MKPCKYLTVLIQKLQTELDFIYHKIHIIQQICVLLNLHGNNIAFAIK